MKKILHVKNYTLEPFGRYEIDGEGNGEEYRKKYIVPELKEGNTLEIHLDGINYEYGSSFLVEAFANIIRKEGFSYDEFMEKIQFKSVHEDWLEDLYSFIEEARIDTQGNAAKLKGL